MSIKNKQRLLKRHKRILTKLQGSSDKPRLLVRRSINNLYAQIIDDTKDKVLFSLSTLDKDFKAKSPVSGNVKSAQAFGELFSLKAREKGFSRIVFDRAGYMYHGRIKAFAEGLRKGGLAF